MELLMIFPARFMRHLAAMGYLKEIAADTYERNTFIKAMATPYIGQGYPML